MAKKKRKKVASRGSVNDIILKTLLNGDKYGYEIIKEVEEYSDGKMKLKQPSLYSSLSRFEEKGLVNSYWGDSDIGGRRHYYHLTDEGKVYYTSKNSRLERIHTDISSIDDDKDIEDDDLVENVGSSDIKISNMDKTTESTNSEKLNIQLEEISSIPAVVDFPQNQIAEKVEIIPDHNFHVETPIEKQLENIQTNISSAPNEANEYAKKLEINTTSNVLTNNNCSTETNDTSNTKTNTNSNIWKILADKVKLNNKRYTHSQYRILHLKKRKIVILDKDGIYKLREKGYTPTPTKSMTIIDNVGKRIEPKNMHYGNYSINHNKNANASKELTDEERRLRNENFLAKFNSLTKSKMKVVPEKIIEEKPKIEIDYRKKLDAFIDNEDEETTNSYVENTNSTINQTNNLFNYVDEEDEETINSPPLAHGVIDDEDDDKFINFEPEELNTNNEDRQYIEEISQFHSTKNDIKMNRYENKSNAILSDKSYVLINRVKCLFGVILLLCMIAEISLSLVIFKKYNLIFDNDKMVFILAYIISIIVSLTFILPIMFNPNEHKINTFKLKYSIIFGILTFLVSVILIYCINSLLGFDLNNFKYFAVKIILPIIMTFNFVIMPPIYSALISNKKFYD